MMKLKRNLHVTDENFNRKLKKFRKCDVCGEEESPFSCEVMLCERCISRESTNYQEWLTANGVESIWDIETSE